MDRIGIGSYAIPCSPASFRPAIRRGSFLYALTSLLIVEDPSARTLHVYRRSIRHARLRHVPRDSRPSSPVRRCFHDRHWCIRVRTFLQYLGCDRELWTAGQVRRACAEHFCLTEHYFGYRSCSDLVCHRLQR